MMIKMFEILDRNTFIPAIAIKMTSSQPKERWLLMKGGFTNDIPLICLFPIHKTQVHWNYHNWNDRTFTVAHNFITQNFDELKSGAVIDVEFILGEKLFAKESERFAEQKILSTILQGENNE